MKYRISIPRKILILKLLFLTGDPAKNDGDHKDNFTDHAASDLDTNEASLLQRTSPIIICKEDWDNDIAYQDNALDTSIFSNSTSDAFQQSFDSEAYSSQKEFCIDVSRCTDLSHDEASSMRSTDSELWTEYPSEMKHLASSFHFLSERDWLDALESVYFADMITEFKQLLPRAFEASKNCYDFVIFVVKFADFDIQIGKKSLAYLTLVEFEAWLKSKCEGRSIDERKLLGYWPTDRQRDLALEVVVSLTFLFFEPIKRTFQLDVGENSFLAKHVRFLMHSKRRYKEVS